MMRTFVMSDIHGMYKALLQCFSRSGFDYEKDRLIYLGDTLDHGPDGYQVIEELLKIKHFVFVLGNHDYWIIRLLIDGEIDPIWDLQGGRKTLEHYPEDIPQTHIDFFESGQFFYLEDNRLFVHGGYIPFTRLSDHERDDFMWDRKLFFEAIHNYHYEDPLKLIEYDEVYLGHCPVSEYGYKTPLNHHGLWMLDTGAGYDWKLSIMDIESKEFFQSDCVMQLYPNHVPKKMS